MQRETQTELAARVQAKLQAEGRWSDSVSQHDDSDITRNRPSLLEKVTGVRAAPPWSPANGTATRNRTQTQATTPEFPAPPKRAAGQLVVARGSEITPRAVKWLWQGYLPIGKVMVVDGFPGQGKTTALIHIGACGSSVSPDARAIMPGGTQAGCVGAWSTLVLSYEDDADDTLLPRWIAAGGVRERLHVVRGVVYNGDSEDNAIPPTLPNDIELVDGYLGKHPEIKLVIVDPLMASVSERIDSHKDQDIRRVISKLRSLAEKRRVALALVRHVKKSHGTNAILAGGGSIGIIGGARTGWLIDQHPDNPESSVLAIVKSNVAAVPPSLTFRKISVCVGHDPETNEPIETAKLEWTGEAALSADELLAARVETEPGDGHDQQEWLREVLSEGPVDSSEVVKLAAKQGIKERTLRNLRRKIGAIVERTGKGKDHKSTWRLSTPATSALVSGASGSAGVAGVGFLDGLEEREL